MDLLDQQFEELRKTFGQATLRRRGDNTAAIEIKNFPLPEGWSTPDTSILFVVPAGYPVARPDCFWADANLKLASGQPPANSTPNNQHGGPENRLWFSWHPSSWNPNVDSLITYVNVVRRRLQELR
jgi:hypothetical protein